MNGKKEEYIQAYTEINCLLKYFPIEYIKKLPKKLLEMIQNNSDEKYNISIDTSKDLQSQNISKKAQGILVVLKYNYWSDEKEKQYLKDKFYENERKFQEELLEKYNPDNIFKNRKQDDLKVENNISDKVAMVEYKENILKKFINKIFKTIFRKN